MSCSFFPPRGILIKGFWLHADFPDITSLHPTSNLFVSQYLFSCGGREHADPRRADHHRQGGKSVKQKS
jgi:hypothetical protein